MEVMKPTPAAKLTWKSVQSTVADAKAASERLLRDASRYVQKIREANDTGLVSKMSDIMGALQGNIKDRLPDVGKHHWHRDGKKQS